MPDECLDAARLRQIPVDRHCLDKLSQAAGRFHVPGRDPFLDNLALVMLKRGRVRRESHAPALGTAQTGWPKLSSEGP
jgi:hypothetical protein